jgi:hypothetical protein
MATKRGLNAEGVETAVTLLRYHASANVLGLFSLKANATGIIGINIGTFDTQPGSPGS